MFSALAVVLVILVLLCCSAAIILILKRTKLEPTARTYPLASSVPARVSSQLEQPRAAAAQGAHTMAAEASRVVASDDLAAQRRREGKPVGFSPHMLNPWDLNGIEVPPLIMAELRQSPVPMDDILLSTERTIFERIHAEQQELQQQSQQQPQQPPPLQASAPLRTATPSIVDRCGADAPAAQGGGATDGSGSAGLGSGLGAGLPAGGMQLLRQLGHEASLAPGLLGEALCHRHARDWAESARAGARSPPWA